MFHVRKLLQKPSKESNQKLDSLLGQDTVGRPHLVHEAKALALRKGQWKYIPPATTREKLGPWRQVKVAAPGFLYDLAVDPSETKNVAKQRPAKLKEMRELLNHLRNHADQS